MTEFKKGYLIGFLVGVVCMIICATTHDYLENAEKKYDSTTAHITTQQEAKKIRSKNVKIYGGCDFINTEYEECVVLLDGFCPVCGKKICIEEGETEPTPEECWQAFKQYYPGEYKEAMKIKRGEK